MKVPIGFKRGVLSLLILYSIFHLGYSIWRYNPISFDPSGGDFRQTFRAVLEWKRTGSFEVVNQYTGYVYYPPLYYMSLLPFTGLGLRHASYFFYFLQFLLFPCAVFFLVKAASKERAPVAIEYLLAALLTVNFQPFLSTLAQYKVEGFTFSLTCLAIYLFRKKKDLWTGVVVLVAAALKYFPGILAFYFFFRRQHRVMLGVLVSALVILFLVLLPVLGIHTVRSIVIQHPIELLVNPNIEFNRPDANPERQTLGGAVYRFFAVPPPGSTFEHQLQIGICPIAHPSLAGAITSSLKLLLGGLYLYFIASRRKWGVTQREEKWAFYLLEIALTLPMIVIIAQGVRVHYAILLLPSYVIVALLLYQRWAFFRWGEKILFFLSYALSAMMIPGGLLNQLPRNPLWGKEYANMYLWLSLPFYGYMLLGLCILLCYRRLSQHEPAPAAG